LTEPWFAAELQHSTIQAYSYSEIPCFPMRRRVLWNVSIKRGR